jgi:ankyrin repeat protein
MKYLKKNSIYITLSLILAILCLSVAAHADLNEALRIAAFNGDTEQVQTLIAEGANVNGRDENGETALMAAALIGHLDTAEALIASGAEVNSVTVDGETALMAAAFAGQTEIVKTLLNSGAQINGTDFKGETALTESSQSPLWGVMMKQ